ncbi:MAG: universal stress protein [Actinomycetes bacterium]
MTVVVLGADLRGSVVVGDDGSAESAHAVRWAIGEARTYRCTLVVLRAWSLTTAPRPATWEPGYVPGEDEFGAAVRDALVDDLRAILGDDPGVHIDYLPVHATPDEALVAATREARLVVVGSHGRHLARARLGSTAEHVVRNAHGPVVVVPVTGH